MHLFNGASVMPAQGNRDTTPLLGERPQPEPMWTMNPHFRVTEPDAGRSAETKVVNRTPLFAGLAHSGLCKGIFTYKGVSELLETQPAAGKAEAGTAVSRQGFVTHQLISLPTGHRTALLRVLLSGKCRTASLLPAMG